MSLSIRVNYDRVRTLGRSRGAPGRADRAAATRLDERRSARWLPVPEEAAKTAGQGSRQSQGQGRDQGQEQASAATERSGEDLRRRGWFWHWNTIITQYAPLVGLKGVGLLNSYTVWTDRRDESPHRGYAFPSQQSEADFYGEDRAELIAINKILVALDLIEIRKEMVLRVDERGRRWRVPHNLYRVKDHREGYSLSVDDVLRVVELAAHDRAVYRYIRRIFSPRFTPIDRDNVWHQILPIARQSPSWQQLAARAEREEARASARTKAGHASRSRPGDQAAPADQQASDSTAGASQLDDDQSPSNQASNGGTNGSSESVVVAGTNNGLEADVAPANRGSNGAVAPDNSGSSGFEAGIAGPVNQGPEGVVDGSNTTYYQDRSTTTTTTTGLDSSSDDDAPPGADRLRRGGAGPLLDPAPAVLACFEAANDRTATPLERELLAELEELFDAPAARVGATGGEWVAAAIREAVSSGSRFVAPKRIREILSRWAVGQPEQVEREANGGTDRAARHPDRLRSGGAPSAAPAVGAFAATPDLPDIPLPHGAGSRRTWDYTLRLLGQVIDRAELERHFAGSGIADYQAGTVTIRVASSASAGRLGAEYADLVARKLSEALRRPARVRFVAADTSRPGSNSESTPDEIEAAGRPIGAPPGAAASTAEADGEGSAAGPALPARPPLGRFMLPEGLSNVQLWAAAQDELARRLTPASFAAWVRPAALIGLQPDGALVVGAPTSFARQRLESLLPELRATLSGLLGRPVVIELVVNDDWFRQQVYQRD